MECDNNEEEKNKEKEKKDKNDKNEEIKKHSDFLNTKDKKYKIIKNRTKNHILNIVAYLINNRNDFPEKLKPSDLEIILETDSINSTYNNMKYKTKLSYSTFNPKRDLVSNIHLYQQIPAEIEINDEYYTNNEDNIIINIYPEIKKGIILDITQFPFFTYEEEDLHAINKDEIKNLLVCDDSTYNLCVYITDYKQKGSEQISMIENILETDMFFDYFKNIFVFIQLDTQSKINDIKNDEKLKSYLIKNEKNENIENNNNKYKEKIKLFFNFVSSYNIKEKNHYLINIFGENKRLFLDELEENYDNKNYFFILDNNKKIVEIQPLKKLGEIITLLLLKLKKNKNNNKLLLFEQKEIEEKKRIKDAIKLIHFITNIKKLNLNYIFNIKFKISFSVIPDDNLTKIDIKKINQIRLEGEFFTKECNYIKEIQENLKSSSTYEINLKEMKTIDIDIDFKNMECEKCKNIIKEDDYLYYCYICKLKYCYECVQSQLKNKMKKDKYIDKKHHLLFFKTKDINNFKEIEKIKLGKNKFAECDEDDLGSWSSTRCNGCSKSLNNYYRYLCLSCRKGMRQNGGYIDFCSKCIEKMCNNKNDKENLEKTANGIIDNFHDFLSDFKFKVEHFHDTHLYLMMPYQIASGGYDDF